MNAAPRLYREEPPPPKRAIFWQPWVVSGLAVLVLLVVGWYSAVETHNAAVQCQQAAQEIREARSELQATRQHQDMLDRENERQAAVIAVLQERLKRQLAKEP